MQTIQVVLDEPLLHSAERAAQQAGINRSALVREALRVYLRQLEVREQERRDREGYRLHPEASDDELAGWDQVAAAPEAPRR